MDIIDFADDFYPLDKTSRRKRTSTRYTIHVPVEGICYEVTAVDQPMTLAWSVIDYPNANMPLQYSFSAQPGDFLTPLAQSASRAGRHNGMAVGERTSVQLEAGQKYYLNYKYRESALRPEVVASDAYTVFTRMLA